MRSFGLSCGIILLSGLSLTAQASLITYTETVTGSGTLGSHFSNQLVTITGTGDTSDITIFAPGIYELVLSTATVQIGAGPVATFTGGFAAFDNTTLPGAGLTQLTPSPFDVLDTSASVFAAYALNTSISGSGTAFINSLTNFSTSAGSFNLNSVSGNSTFTAVLDTPEPSSLVLCATGLLGLAAAARRRLAQS